MKNDQLMRVYSRTVGSIQACCSECAYIGHPTMCNRKTCQFWAIRDALGLKPGGIEFIGRVVSETVEAVRKYCGSCTTAHMGCSDKNCAVWQVRNVLQFDKRAVDRHAQTRNSKRAKQ